MKLYYSSQLKKYNLGVVTIGQAGLRIPPGQKAYKQSSKCSRDCTRQQITEPMNVVSVGLHMHYIGKKRFATSVEAKIDNYYDENMVD